jgi:hypothetical protein
VIRVNCPGCGRECEFADYLRRLTAVCKNCGHRIPVPAAEQRVSATEEAVTSAPGAVLPQTQAAPTPLRPSDDAIQPMSGTTPPALSVSLERPETRPLVHGPSESLAFPDWAVESADAWLRVGRTVPEIEQRLVERGLPPAVAAAAVTRALERQLRRQHEPFGEGEVGERWHRILSAAAGCVCLLIAYWYGGGRSAGYTLIWIVWPLAGIWFPEAITRSSDPDRTAAARWVGWLVLLFLGGCRLVLLVATSG